MKRISISVLIILVLTVIAMPLTAGEAKDPPAKGDSYYDIATGHKYLKNGDGSYREYSRKGILLKESVANTLPLLTSNKYIREVPENCYFLYRKNGYRTGELKVLPSNRPSPAGWKCIKMLVSSN